MSTLGDSLTPSSAATQTSNSPDPSTQDLPSRSSLSRTPSDNAALTPSLLTPNTRAQAEFEFTSNATVQTESAAPALDSSSNTALPPTSAASTTSSDGAPRTRRPLIPPSTASGSNYIAALAKIPAGEPLPVEKVEGKGGVVRGVFARQGSWRQEDMKRERMRAELERGGGEAEGYSSVQRTEGEVEKS